MQLHLSGLILISHAISLCKFAFGSDEVIYVSENKYLYHIDTDPYENKDVIDNDKFATDLAYMEERREYWSTLTISPSQPDVTNQSFAWETCGRVCPWTISDYTKLSVDQIYSYSEAPHIVYVLVDDWGYNDYGARSTYLSWTTPNIDKLASEGILLENYYTSELCGPSRGSLLTGRYALRLGLESSSNELPITETILPAELKSAGYKTYMVGKWHLGQSEYRYMPLQRGFDYFYGYLNGFESYYTKEYFGYVDLWENNDYVTDSTDLDSSYHSAYLFQKKVEEVIENHAETYADTPMFLYYAMHLVHYPWTAPEVYLERCTENYAAAYVDDDDGDSENDYTLINYCAMNVMMDEAIANLTCALEKYGFSDNTVLIIAGDNGGESAISGSNYPFRGSKATVMRGAFSNTAVIHSQLVPESRRGGTYSDDVHITDWYPTLMHLATNGEWTGGYNNQTIDGHDVWDNIIDDTDSDRDETVFVSHSNGIFSMQYNGLKYIYHTNDSGHGNPTTTFDEDLNPSLSSISCTNPSLVDDDYSSYGFSYSSSSFSNTSQVTSTFLMIALGVTLVMLMIGIIITFKTTIVADPKNMDIYVAYKEGNDGENAPLISKI
jgi:arylsulfatase A-like enzyme